ncbi:MAG TPA: undecaprenyl-diphosphate phosphatase [Acidimicrobiia bacterium]|nr:undecaprenyl-diphosphate phosphatase [Acidimicrobiia bacterium]
MPQIVIDMVLGLVQGLTEFLPVSSSGHLVVVPAVFGWDEPSLSFDLVLHLGTLVAVVVYFWNDLWGMATGVFGRGADPEGSRRLLLLVAVGTIPAALAGLLLDGFFESFFEEPLWVCLFWLVTAAVLLLVERAGGGGDRPLDMRVALLVGCAQAAAIMPGISRAGSTIAAGLALGLSREDAARFSFLLSVPAITGAGLTIVPDIASGSFDVTGSVAAGFVVAALSGYLAVAGLLRLIRTRTLVPFSAYLVIASPVAATVLIAR